MKWKGFERQAGHPKTGKKGKKCNQSCASGAQIPAGSPVAGSLSVLACVAVYVTAKTFSPSPRSPTSREFAQPIEEHRTAAVKRRLPRERDNKALEAALGLVLIDLRAACDRLGKTAVAVAVQRRRKEKDAPA